jgi:hypothetical protein
MPSEVTGRGQGWFVGSGAVGQYWQTRCLGFEVRSTDGRTIGTVERVELQPLSRQSPSVVVHRRGRTLRSKTLRMGAGSIELVDPWKRMVVASLPRDRPSAARRGAVRTGHTLATGAAHTGTAGRQVASLVREAAPPTGRFGVWLGARAVYLVALLGWLYAVVVFAVSRVAVRVLLAASKALAWTSVRIAPRLAHLAQAAARKSEELVRRAPRPTSSAGRR